MTKKTEDNILLQFTNDELEKTKIISPVAPNGQTLDFIKLEVRSSLANEPAEKIERLTQKSKLKYFKSQQKGELYQMSLDEKREFDIECAKIVLVGFEGVKLEGGKELEYNEENKEMFLRRFWWIVKQVIDTADNHSFFYRHEEKK